MFIFINFYGYTEWNNWVHGSRGVNFPSKFGRETEIVCRLREANFPARFSREILLMHGTH